MTNAIFKNIFFSRQKMNTNGITQTSQLAKVIRIVDLSQSLLSGKTTRP